MGNAYPIHNTSTGSFQELARKSQGIEFGQLSLLTINPLCSRGNHYHSYKTEWFCCLFGEGKLNLKNIDTGEEFSFLLSELERKFIEVTPRWVHTVVNDSEIFPLSVLIIIDEEFEENTSDTYQL
jgi:UDP-2-acetamido-2,6-beta-L-arabino-hexul-4-ose reductase